MNQTLNIEAFNPKKAELQELANKLQSVRSVEITDSKTYKQVHEAQMELRNARISIEKTGKAMREDANTFIKTVRSVELDMLAVITPLEDELKSKKEAYDTEQERIKQEEENRKQQAIADRTLALAKYGEVYDTLKHGTMNDEAFDTLISSLETEYQEKEQARIAQEEADRKAREAFEEEQRKFREEQEAIAQKNREEQEKIEAEKKKIEDEKRAIEQAKIDEENKKKRQEELEKAREEARLQALRDAELEAERKRIADEQKAKEEQEALAKKKKYQAFCESIGLTAENANEFTFVDTTEGRKFYKFVGIYEK